MPARNARRHGELAIAASRVIDPEIMEVLNEDWEIAERENCMFEKVEEKSSFSSLTVDGDYERILSDIDSSLKDFEKYLLQRRRKTVTAR
jgi:hypothetical protein